MAIDDFEDGDTDSNFGDGWYSYDDTGNNGASTISIELTNEGHDSKYSFKATYKLDKGDYAHDPYVGWGVSIPNTTDFSKLEGISYWYKGGDHTMRLETSDVTDYDVYGYSVSGSSEWKQATIKFTSLYQEGWGAEVDFIPENIKALSFQIKGDGAEDNLQIDDIKFIGKQ